MEESIPLRDDGILGWGEVGWRVGSPVLRPVGQTHQGFQLAPLQRLVLMARAREAEFLQELGEACLNHGERAEVPRPAAGPAGGRPCVSVSIPSEARPGSAFPSLLGQVQVTKEPPTCPQQVRPRPRAGLRTPAHPSGTLRTWPCPVP